MKRVLVTGATGFVGQHVIPQLLERGYEVTAVARNETVARNFSWFNRVDFVACDIHDPNDCPVGRFGQLESIVHLAWPGLPNYRALSHFEENLLADYRFLKRMLEGGGAHLLITGTCFEYGLQSGPLSENMPTAPNNPYALAKDTLRKFLHFAQQQNDFTLQWARLFYMYGPGQNKNSLLAQLDRAIDNGESVFNMSGGEQLRDYLSVETVASRLVTLLEYPNWNGVVNICSGDPISVRHLVELHVKKRGVKIKLNLGYYPYVDYEPMAFWGDGSRYKSIVRSL